MHVFVDLPVIKGGLGGLGGTSESGSIATARPKSKNGRTETQLVDHTPVTPCVKLNY